MFCSYISLIRVQKLVSILIYVSTVAFSLISIFVETISSAGFSSLLIGANYFFLQYSNLCHCCRHLLSFSTSGELLWARNASQANPF
jgi:hypothetical protein